MWSSNGTSVHSWRRWRCTLLRWEIGVCALSVVESFCWAVQQTAFILPLRHTSTSIVTHSLRHSGLASGLCLCLGWSASKVSLLLRASRSQRWVLFGRLIFWRVTLQQAKSIVRLSVREDSGPLVASPIRIPHSSLSYSTIDVDGLHTDMMLIEGSAARFGSSILRLSMQAPSAGANLASRSPYAHSSCVA